MKERYKIKVEVDCLNFVFGLSFFFKVSIEVTGIFNQKMCFERKIITQKSPPIYSLVSPIPVNLGLQQKPTLDKITVEDIMKIKKGLKVL